MLIAVQGFGSIWSCRPARENAGTGRGAPAYYNTTGVPVGTKIRHRSCLYGYLRIDACTGFAPHAAYRAIHRIFECDGTDASSGARKLYVTRPTSSPAVPEFYLVVLASAEIGWINRDRAWLCEAGQVLSLSEGNGQQESLVVLPPFGWIRSLNGVFCLEPDAEQPRCAALRNVRPEV